MKKYFPELDEINMTIAMHDAYSRIKWAWL